MQATQCSLCINKCLPQFDKSFGLNTNRKRGNACDDYMLENQLNAVFLFRKILEIPQDICCKFLENYGNPCSWIDCCVSCSLLVQNGKLIFDQMMVLQKQFKMVQNQLEKQIVQALASEENLFAEDKLRVKETMRSFIRQGNSKHLSHPIINSTESTLYGDTVDTNNFVGYNQCVKNDSDDYFDNPFIVCEDEKYRSTREDEVDPLGQHENVHKDDEYHFKRGDDVDPLGEDKNGNQVDTHSDLDIKEEPLSYQPEQSEMNKQNFNNEHSKNFNSSEGYTFSENVKTSGGLNQQIINEKPKENEYLVPQDGKGKEKRNSQCDIISKTIKNKRKSPTCNIVHVPAPAVVDASTVPSCTWTFHQCSVCGKHICNRHRRANCEKRHRDGVVSCPRCGVICKWKKNLSRHLKKCVNDPLKK